MAALAPVRTETAPRRSWHFLHRYRKAPSSTIDSSAGVWRRSVENRAAFSTGGAPLLSVEGLAVVHATGYGLRATGYSRLYNQNFQVGESPRSEGRTPVSCRPTPERRWRERNVAQRSNSRRLARRASNASHPERSVGADVRGKRFCLTFVRDA